MMIKVFFGFIVLFLWILLFALELTILHIIYPKGIRKATVIFYKGWCKIFGIKVNVIGKPSEYQPTFFVSNHMGIMDIAVLASVLKAPFISRGDLASWPLIGYMAKLQNTFFAIRESKYAKKQSEDLENRFKKDKESLIIFAEGTSTEGRHVLPFKSSLFQIGSLKMKYGKKEEFLKIQPISISFTKLHDMPVTYNERFFYSWIGDEDLFPSLYGFMKLGRKEVTVEFHDVVSMKEYNHRKNLANYCHDVIENTVSLRLAGK